ncbi:beta-ketoacyl-[acyl-carrier-protein] synthase family protein [Shewanella cyperi]|uniref:Beta-ketoacyl-[acyl-carrier-protein] synthase family protein n=1 Tax=Shewanella cyperi TaxID=2814292 RepID=A0A975AL49_9GAMM|nr:beta-ketoacyl-[acyl-carrier-protein] synthase family protein [Shewanella cyperi]QSX29883.1 beta-ketoacyl-[acyl-carrier-protein] synthase family protein [Shewanella cyperi]
MTKIAITQIGLCTPLGSNPDTVLNRLLAADTSAMVWRDDLLLQQQTLVGAVGDADLPQIAPELARFDCRNNQLLLAAAKSLQATVAAARVRYGADRIAVVLGTSTSGISKGEEALKYRAENGHFPAEYHYFQQELGSTSDFLRRVFDLDGPCYTLSTACSSSAKVFASGKRLLDANLADMVIVGGVDTLCKLTLNGFDALESVSKGHCNPFSANRDGINIGEGAALFALERGDNGILLSGIGESADAHHISAPHPEGEGAMAAMSAALADAGLTAADIDYINLHGTATPKNDAMESRAVTGIFGAEGPWCSSTKPLTGHALGAAGALEAAFCVLLLSDLNRRGGLPLQHWDGVADPADPKLRLVSAKAPRFWPKHVMSNSFAFGGSNASLIFSRSQADD